MEEPILYCSKTFLLPAVVSQGEEARWTVQGSR